MESSSFDISVKQRNNANKKVVSRGTEKRKSNAKDAYYWLKKEESKKALYSI